MYGLYRLDASATQITLPTPAGVGRPYGTPTNVWVLHGDVPAVVDTGLRGSRQALLMALAEAGIDPLRVGRICLTSHLPEALGNLEIFPNAGCWTVGRPSAPLAQVGARAAALCAHVTVAARELLAGEGGHPEWSGDEIDAFAATYLEGMPAALDGVSLRDGQRVAAGDTYLEVMATPGVDVGGACFYDPARARLFCGGLLSMLHEPLVRDPQQYSASLSRVSQLQPAEILPACGGVERSYPAVFRSLGLWFNNLMSHMPFALDGATSVPVIAMRDLGYWPRDLIRFTADVLRFQSILDELVRAGVASRQGQGAWALYSMERPSRY